MNVKLLVIFLLFFKSYAWSNEEASEGEGSKAQGHAAEKVLEAEYLDGSSHEKHQESHEEASFLNLIQMPEKCITKKTTPCYVKVIDKGLSFKVEKAQIFLKKESILKMESFEPLVLVPLQGAFVIEDFKSDLKVGLYKVKGFQSYVTKLKDKIEVIDGADLYQYTIAGEEVEREFLDREEFVKKIAPFFKNKTQLKNKLTEVSALYRHNFNQEVVKNQKFLNRKVASVEENEANFLKQEQAKKEHSKKIKKEFYKKTFEN